MSVAAHHYRLDGFEPDNLLAFLALLGLLRAVVTARPDWRPRASWDVRRSPLRPVLVLRQDETHEAIGAVAAAGAATLATTHVFPTSVGSTETQKDLNYTEDVARHLLQHAQTLEGDAGADLWAALMCDAAAKGGKIVATPLCLLFGQGHQHFLDRLTEVPRIQTPPPRGRGRNAVAIDPAETMCEALFAPWSREDPTPAFRWDPAEDVRYALRADDPSGSKTTTQHGANRLAALGLAAITAAPAQRGDRVRLQVIGGMTDRNGFSFAWPIWRDPASLEAIRALLSHPALQEEPQALAYLGVDHVRRAQRIRVGKFMNFTRAEAI